MVYRTMLEGSKELEAGLAERRYMIEYNVRIVKFKGSGARE